MNDLIPVSYEAVPLAVKRDRNNYLICTPTGEQKKLHRDVDFGMIRKKDGSAMTKNPTLFKSGAEKICMAYGLCQRYTIESRIESPENGLFLYVIRCDLVKIECGQEYVITSSYGSANTQEKRNGYNKWQDSANSALKMAQKRALVSAALSLGCVSDMFTQDIESDVSEDAAVYNKPKDPESPITSKQVTFLYAACGRHGLTKDDAKKFIKDHGYHSAKEIRSGDFDSILDDLDKEGTDAE